MNFIPSAPARLGAFLLALSSGLAIGSAHAADTPRTVQRGYTTTGMNEQTTNYENAVSEAIASRYAPIDPQISISQDRRVRLWTHEDLHFMNFNGTTGTTGALLVGADAQWWPDVTLGAFAGYTKTNANSEFMGLGGNYDEEGAGFGLYFGAQLAENVALDGFFAYSHQWLDLRQNHSRGSTMSDRFAAGLGIQASYDFDGIQFMPRASISFTQDLQDSYESRNARFPYPAVSDQESTLLRGFLGGRVGTTHDVGSYQVNSWLLAGAEFTADDAGSVSRVDDGVSGRFGLGMSIPVGSLLFSIEGNAAGIGANDYVDYGGMFSISYAFD